MENRNPIWQNDSMSLHVLQFGRLRTNTGVFVNGEAKSAFLVDAPFGSHEFLKNSLLSDITVEAVLVTHGHWDHIGDCHLFREDGTKVYAHMDDRWIIECPDVIGMAMGVTRCPIDCVLDEDSRFSLAGVEVCFRHVPGHSPGGVAFYLEFAGVAFVGDTLFNDCIGRYDLPGGNGQKLVSSIRRKILSLPGDTIVIPGHGWFTTVKYEGENNKYLQ